MGKSVSSDQIFSGLVWKFGERFLTQGVSFLVSIVLARLLAPDDYGVISLVMIFMYLADTFVVSGFNTALIQKSNASSLDFSTMFYCSFACSLVVYLVLFAAAPWIADFYQKPILIQVLRVFGLRIPLSAYNSIQSAYVSRHMMFQRFFFSSLAGSFVSGAIGILMAYMGFGVWALVAQYLSNMAVNTLVLAFTIPWHLELKFSWLSAKSLMNYGWKVLVSELAGTFFDHLRTLVVGRFYTSAQLAYYDKGQQLPTLISSNISASAMAVLFPAISNASSHLDRVKQMTKRAIRIMSYVIFPMMTGLAVVARPLVILLFTEKWAPCIPFLQVFCISSGISLLGITALQAIKAIGRSDVLLRIELEKKPVYLVFLIIGVKISIFATAVTLVMYSVYGVFVNMWQLKKYVAYGIREQLRDILPAGLLSLSMGLLLSGFTLLDIREFPLLLLQILTGVAYYITTSKILKIDSYIYVESVLLTKLREVHQRHDRKNN